MPVVTLPKFTHLDYYGHMRAFVCATATYRLLPGMQPNTKKSGGDCRNSYRFDITSSCNPAW